MGEKTFSAPFSAANWAEIANLTEYNAAGFWSPAVEPDGAKVQTIDLDDRLIHGERLDGTGRSVTVSFGDVTEVQFDFE